MSRYEWPDRGETRRGDEPRDGGADAPRREGYGPADYSSEWSYDRERGRPREVRSGDGPPEDRYSETGNGRDERSWMDRAGDFLAGGEENGVRRRRGPSDRVLWAVIVERLKAERGLDLTDVELLVENAEVTLNGTVRRKDDKRRIEDVTDIEGVRHVQNNLRVRDRGHWTFL